MSAKQYAVKEIFGPTLQGEGHRAGTVTMFLRFAGCNLQCVDGSKFVSDRLYGPTLRGNEIDVGWFCDTDFKGGTRMTCVEIVAVLEDMAGPKVRALVISGGEPALQLDVGLVDALRDRGWFVAVETNGTINSVVLDAVDWVSCSPKGETRLTSANEIRCVVREGQAPVVPVVLRSRNRGGAMGSLTLPIHRFVSPAFVSVPASRVGSFRPSPSPDEDALAWAIGWCLENPDWRLSVQQHKSWGVA